MFYVDSNRCTGCGECADSCPQQAISIENGLAVINQDRCRQCGNCATVCPNNAIGETVPIYARMGKGGDAMMRGGGWFGRGFGTWGRGMGRGLGRGMGRGNPYPFCRFYPWLPRRWWSYGPGYYPQTTPANYPSYSPYRW